MLPEEYREIERQLRLVMPPDTQLWRFRERYDILRTMAHAGVSPPPTLEKLLGDTALLFEEFMPIGSTLQTDAWAVSQKRYSIIAERAPDEFAADIGTHGADPGQFERCPECHKVCLRVWFVQDRSIDEPSTKHGRCSACNHTIRQRG